ncbi:putative lipase atg15 [Arthrobotrys musiformis]|uniref:triacylglycerol lipase n=1 Tax=Arthrobotrys musiformis TaxID=47236 RepID=A0AAV9VV08_9PEZI
MSFIEFIHDGWKLYSRVVLISLLFLSFSIQALVPDQIILTDENLDVTTSQDDALGGGGGPFKLRHVLHHGVERYPTLLRRLDITGDELIWGVDNEEQHSTCPSLQVKSRLINISRLRDRSIESVEGRLAAARYWGSQLNTPISAWTTEQDFAPDITDTETVFNLAKMSANAYVHIPATEDWRDVGTPWNKSAGFGWENDGLRGHIFLDEKNSTVIISIKGTSVAIFYGEETKTNDKVNDNLFFSCCCARVSAFWNTVCDCYTGTFSCSNPCLSGALKAENRYYRAALNLYYNITNLYPEAQVWLVGHSLGGAVSSLLGLTYGLPVVTFEAPPEALAASRLGIPRAPTELREDGVYHFGNNADPIYMGVCNGATSFCSIGGYAMETKCHTGSLCLYDVVNDLGWRVNGNSHRIKTVIDDIMPKYDHIPKCIPEDEECTDCFNWRFHNETITTTTKKKSSTTTTTTRSTTCQHPGWFGCLDETSTTTSDTTSITTSPTSSTTIQTTEVSRTSTSTTCSKYGWFGDCIDPTPTKTQLTTATVTPDPTTNSSSTLLPTATTTCLKPGRFWGCRD